MSRQGSVGKVMTAVAGGLLLTLSMAGAAMADAAADAPLADMVPDNVRQEGKIVAGALMDIPPVEFYAISGETKGVNPDLARLVEQQLGIEIEFLKLGFDSLLPSMKSGKIDIIWDSMNDTVPRQEVLDFIDYLKGNYTLLIPAGNPEEVASLADMCGMSIATIRGAVQADAVKEQSEACEAAGEEPIKLALYKTTSDARLQVQTGRVDAFIGNAPALLYLARESSDIFDAVVLDAAETKEAYYGIGFNKSDEQLRKAIAAALDAVIEDGSYAEVLAEYGLDELAVDKTMYNAVGK